MDKLPDPPEGIGTTVSEEKAPVPEAEPVVATEAIAEEAPAPEEAAAEVVEEPVA